MLKARVIPCLDVKDGRARLPGAQRGQTNLNKTRQIGGIDA
ncbi:hypothetical protein MP213Fo_15130 [Pseudochrobactrum sp. MP213Fo]